MKLPRTGIYFSQKEPNKRWAVIAVWPSEWFGTYAVDISRPDLTKGTITGHEWEELVRKHLLTPV